MFNYPCKKSEEGLYLPLLNDFCPLYATVSPEEMEACCHAVSMGGDLAWAVEGRDAKWVQLAYETAVEAETICAEFIALGPDLQIAYPLEGLSDFTLAALYDILLESDHLGAVKGLQMKMNDMLLAVLDSSTATPLLDYEWMFQDAVQYHIVEGRGIDPLWMLKRSLAHEVRYNRGEHVMEICCHMAYVCIGCDDLKEAVRIYTALLLHDPRNFETVHSLATDLACARRFDAAVRVGHRGLELLTSTKRNSSPCPELSAEIASWMRSARSEHAVSLPADLYTQIDDALYASPDNRFDRMWMIREIVPEIDDVPVKRPLLGQRSQ